MSFLDLNYFFGGTDWLTTHGTGSNQYKILFIRTVHASRVEEDLDIDHRTYTSDLLPSLAYLTCMRCGCNGTEVIRIS